MRLYEGEFNEKELYHGKGKLWHNEEKNRKLIYSGIFYRGLPDKSGKFYDIHTGKLIYYGSHISGTYFGKGALFIKDEQILYSGD